MDLDEDGERGREEHGMDIDDDDDDDGEDTLNVTLRTPPRLNVVEDKSSRPNFPSGQFSSPPELRAFHEDEEEDEEPELDAVTSVGLTVPSSRRRANSNYTLSSVRTGRANSQTSFTTASRGSSVRTVSRAPSLASKPSGGSTSDTSSVTGSKRPRAVQDSGLQGRLEEKRAARRVVPHTSKEPVAKENRSKGTVRARAPTARVANSSRPLKPASATSKPVPKVSEKRAESVDVDPYDTLESAEETIDSGIGKETVKRRKIKPGSRVISVERVSSLLGQIPEEKTVGRDKR